MIVGVFDLSVEVVVFVIADVTCQLSNPALKWSWFGVIDTVSNNFRIICEQPFFVKGTQTWSENFSLKSEH